MFDPFRLQDIIEVDAETKEMLKMMDFQSIPGLQMTTAGKHCYSVTFIYPCYHKLWHIVLIITSPGRGGGNPNYQGNRN